MEVGCPGGPGAANTITSQGGWPPSDQYNPQPSHEPPAQAKAKGPVDINQRRQW